MTNVDHDDVRTLLAAAVCDLRPSPELSDRVRRGSRTRRIRHRQAGALLAVGTVLALLGLSALVRPGAHHPVALAPTPGFDQPTRGDLAGDSGYRRTVTVTWSSWARKWQQNKAEYPEVILGTTHLRWALNTPAGRLAIIDQSAEMSIDGQLHSILIAGYLSDIKGRPTVVEAVFDVTDTPPLGIQFFVGDTGGVFVGADRSVLVAFDPGVPVGVSLARNYHPDGTITRDWQPLHFTDGVAIIRVTPKADQGAAVMAPVPYATSQLIGLANVAGGAKPYTIAVTPFRDRPEGRLTWGVYNLSGPDQGGKPDSRTCVAMPLPDMSKSDWQTTPFVDPLSGSGMRVGIWAACGTTPDGSHVTVSDSQLDGDPAFLWYGMVAPTGAARYGYAGFEDRNATLPVKIALPNAQGYVVARAGAVLSYRTGTGPWQGSRHDAALFPADATAVQVAVNGTETVAPLP